MQFQANRPTIPEIAEKLGVNYIIEGSIQRYKENVSIRVQVIRAKNEDHIWGNEYDAKWKDIFLIQDEIALHVANELKTILSPEEMAQIDRKPTDNIEAYNLYLKGRFFWHRRTVEDLETSIDYFNQALVLDENYALAYAGLADAYFILPWYSLFYPTIEAFAKATKYAEKALLINTNIAEAHSALGALAIYNERNWKLAEKELKLAITINPNYDVAHQYYFELLDILGRKNEAEKQINLAIKYNPHFFIYLNQRARFYYDAGRYYDAIEEYQKVIEIKYWPSSLRGLLKCYFKLGKDYEAIEQVKGLVTKNNSENYDILLDEIYQTSGIEGIIYWYIDWLVLNKPQEFENVASFYGIMGNGEKVLEYLEKFMDSDQLGKLYINRDTDFNFLKTEPRFIAMLKQLNLR